MPISSSSPITFRIVAELRAEALANFSASVLEPTGSPVTKCSLIMADKIICPRESGKSKRFSFPREFNWTDILGRGEFDRHRVQAVCFPHLEKYHLRGRNVKNNS